jgi:hypothetical protein
MLRLYTETIRPRGSAWTNPPFYGTLFIAFVALVLPFDSFEGAARTNFAAFFYGLEAVAALAKP